MSHLQQRLAERNIKIADSTLWNIARGLRRDSAVLVMKLDSHMGQNDGDFTTRKESNGDLVFLIVRDSRPVTIFYRRSSQTNTPNQMRVDQILDYTQG
jgi:hypothetical protein